MMASLNWWLVEFVSGLLEREEREAVLGDMVESREIGWERLCGVLGLVLRRQILMWRSWRPWVAGFGVALPSSFLLMGVSVSVSWSYMRLLCPELLRSAELTRGSAIFVLLWQALLLITWAWTSGFVVGSASRRTLWVSGLFCYSPCLFCLSRFRIDSLSKFCLLLFLAPAICGARQGLRCSKLSFGPALALALLVTALMIPMWSAEVRQWWKVPQLSLNILLIWPAWYLVANARKQAGAGMAA
jgi:hypothetical protein